MIILIVGVSNDSTGVPWWLSGLKKKKRHLKCSSHRRLGFDHWVEKIPWRRTWQPIPIFSPGKSHGQRRLEGYSPLGCKESDRAEGTQHARTHTCTNDSTVSLSLGFCAFSMALSLSFPPLRLCIAHVTCDLGPEIWRILSKGLCCSL